MNSGERLGLEMVVGGDLDAATATLTLAGEFDRLQVMRFDGAVEGLPVDLVELSIDLTATTIIDSAALGALIRLRRRIPSNCVFRVRVRTPFQITVMKVSGLSELLGVDHV